VARDPEKSDFGVSAFRVWRGKKFIPCEIASSDFSISWELSIVGGTGGTNSENRGFDIRGFPMQRTRDS
jgi:hypothetical protein